MTVPRRLMLHVPVIVSGPLAARPGHAARALPGRGDTASSLAGCADTLTVVVDTLLPAEAGSPAASTLGVAARILEEMQRQPAFARLLQAGCRWLDDAATARGAAGFSALDEAAREAVLAAAESSDRSSVQRSFFAIVHDQAVDLFYSDPGAWRALDYPGPPQPEGFLDYAEPPGKRTG